MGIGLLIAKSLYLMLPCYLANSSPVLSKNLLKSLAKPIDGGMKFRGQPILGSHKTWRGLIMACITGIMVFVLQKYLYSFGFFKDLSIIDYDTMFSSYSVLPGFLFGFGAILGDAVKSFFKRRAGIESGGRWIPFDQLDFIVGALVMMSFIYVPPLENIIVIVIFTPLIHITSNHLAFYLKIRKEKW